MRRRTFYYQRSRGPGYERALQHIEEARQLSIELGGTDSDVKQYFFGLSSDQLRPILDEYGRRYGQDAKLYAEETLPRWRSGRRRMSGLVASRLFSLLPERMPAASKFALVRSLWEKKCPRSHKRIFVGTEASIPEVIEAVRTHLNEFVKDYVIPEEISKRFQWLAKNDVTLQQELHNYFLQLNRDAISDACDHRIATVMSQVSAANGNTTRVTQDIRIGNHQISLVFHGRAGSITASAPGPIYPAAVPNSWSTSHSDSGSYVGWLVLGGFLLLLWLLANA